ncbi:MAG: cephalosporin hydroxylase family protein [Candidatus Bathyarchaeota archaeon]|nr:cephalosporin hydroxylase family protein [Candidatus Bathyarchaeota archaeon]
MVNEFNKIYYDSKVWTRTYWFGVPILKCPTDLWVYQEILFEQKPDLIIECGTANGGSALFFASLFDLIGNGEIVTIDIEDKRDRPQHKRIKYLLGSTTSECILSEVTALAKNKKKILVILDSDHSKEHVLNELRLYNSFVTKGSYLVVEDTNINGHPVCLDFGAGPMEAVDEFLKEHRDFIVDTSKEKFFVTFNPSGYLKKIT